MCFTYFFPPTHSLNVQRWDHLCFFFKKNKIQSVTALRIVLDIMMFLTYCGLKFNRRISNKGCSVVSVALKSLMASLFPVYSLNFQMIMYCQSRSLQVIYSDLAGDCHST